MAPSEPDTDADTEADADSDDEDAESFDPRIERAFTCELCGYAMVHEVSPLRAVVQSVCHNCGDWTTQRATVPELVETARDLATDLAGETLTERQALAYLLRVELGIAREAAAEAMDSTPSNVDNLQRRAAEKVADAERVVEALEDLRPDEGPVGEANDEADSGGDESATGPRWP